jgi:hypothetical protein
MKVNPIVVAVENYESSLLTKFKPNRKFYDKTGINQKRWGKILCGDESPRISELKVLSEIFKTPIESLY